jgi:hypothetical protein
MEELQGTAASTSREEILKNYSEKNFQAILPRIS